MNASATAGKARATRGAAQVTSRRGWTVRSITIWHERSKGQYGNTAPRSPPVSVRETGGGSGGGGGGGGGDKEEGG